jgi:hypothetical protein
MRTRKIVGVILGSLACGALLLGFLAYRGLAEMGYMEVGMAELHLPSGSIAYLRRQGTYPDAGELYLSESNDYCAPPDRWHDFRFPNIIHGNADSPLLISVCGNTITVFSPEKPRQPWFTRPKAFTVVYEEISQAAYEQYSKPETALPAGWQRVAVPFGNNTCAL